MLLLLLLLLLGLAVDFQLLRSGSASGSAPCDVDFVVKGGEHFELKDQKTPHVKQGDDLGWWEQMMIGWERGRWMDR